MIVDVARETICRYIRRRISEDSAERWATDEAFRSMVRETIEADARQSIVRGMAQIWLVDHEGRGLAEWSIFWGLGLE